MKVVIVNTYDKKGGAAIAAGRLHTCLKKAGIQASRLVIDNLTESHDKNSICYRLKKRFNFYWERITIFLHNKFNRKDLFKVSIANTGFNISQHPAIKEADIINLHWINQGFLSLQNIREIINTGKPVIWTLHDLWPATGICHYPGNCDKYKEICYECPFMGKQLFSDLAKSIYQKKGKISLEKVYFAGCSKWITGKAKESRLLHKSSFKHIPNPIDTNLYFPQTQKEARQVLNIQSDKKLLLFVADNIHDKRKGLAYLVEACRIMAQTYPSDSLPEILLMGKGSGELTDSLSFRIHPLNYLSEPAHIRAAYSSADLFVIPSLEDNLPNTIMEALACGTPCCGFNIGGIPEMIDHMKNGYIAQPENATDLAKGIHWILSHPDNSDLKKAARNKVLENYSENIISEQYINLYKELTV